MTTVGKQVGPVDVDAHDARPLSKKEMGLCLCCFCLFLAVTTTLAGADTVLGEDGPGFNEHLRMLCHAFAVIATISFALTFGGHLPLPFHQRGFWHI